MEADKILEVENRLTNMYKKVDEELKKDSNNKKYKAEYGVINNGNKSKK